MNDADFYELEDPVEQLQYLLRYVDGSLLRIMPDGIEALPNVNPVKAGRAITTFRVAAAHFGFESTVLYGDPIVVAVRETCAPEENLRALFPAIAKRHSKEHFCQEPLAPGTVKDLCDLIDRYPETLSLFPRRRIRDLGLSHHDRALEEYAPALVILKTDDDRISRVKAGEILELLLLRMILDGLDYSLFEVEGGLLIRLGRLTAPVAGIHPVESIAL